MVRVQQEVLPGGVQPARGTKSAAELAMHTDSADILSLLWVHQAASGGASQFSSGPAAHNTILETRPDILPILYKGFPHHRRSEQPDDQPDVTPYDVPIFSNVDGRVCINFTYSSILPALHVLGRTLTDEEANGKACEVVRRKIREVVNDPQIAERLTPHDYPIGAKRMALDTNYWATFNRPNVQLVDIRETPIDQSMSVAASHCERLALPYSFCRAGRVCS